MTCRDCIHFADCLVIGKTRYYGKDAACNNVEELCKYFKNKDNFVEVVRCGDCKHLEPIKESKAIWCNKQKIFLKQGHFNHFCSYGELKEREQ